MKIPSFDEFFETITKEKVTLWVECIGPATIKFKPNENGKCEIDATEFIGLNLSLTHRFLAEYHEWLSEQLNDK